MQLQTSFATLVSSTKVRPKMAARALRARAVAPFGLGQEVAYFAFNGGGGSEAAEDFRDDHRDAPFWLRQ